MLTIQRVRLADLLINKDNDRHGETESEPAAISELLVRYPDKMRALAKDLVKQKRMYERPLVTKEGTQWLVHDGNRRVTCLTLLASPPRSPTAEWTKFFEGLRKEWRPPARIEVEVSDDPNEINEILFRRHTGAQSGVGRLPWDNPAKSTFQHRIGRAPGLELGRKIEELLKAEGLLAPDERIPRTNVERLFSSNPLRQRAGFVVERKQIVFVRDRGDSLRALKRVVSDLQGRAVNISGLITNEEKRKYFDRIEAEGALPYGLPTTAPASPPSKPTDRGQPTPSEPTRTRPAPPRENLIPRTLSPAWPVGVDTRRLQEFWSEAQFGINLSDHPNSVGMVFRAILELSIDAYCDKGHLVRHQGDKLHLIVKKCADHLLSRSLIDSNYATTIEKLAQKDAIISCHTLNQYVHSKDVFVSPQHVRAIWNTLQNFIVILIEN